MGALTANLLENLLKREKWMDGKEERGLEKRTFTFPMRTVNRCSCTSNGKIVIVVAVRVYLLLIDMFIRRIK